MFKKREEKPKKLNEKDVGLIQDLLFAVKNLVAAENHCRESFVITNEEIFRKLEDKIRRRRSVLMDLFVKKNFGHVWCISKHLCAASMGLEEVGSRFNQTNQVKEASILYSLMAETELDIMEINDIEGGTSTSA